MENVESELEALMKEKMEFDKSCIKRLRDLERERRRILKGNTTNSGGRDLNHCGKKDNDNQCKNLEVEEGVTSRDVSRNCDLNRIDKINKNLDKENLELFEQSCFGHLLKIYSNELIFQGQVFRQLLMHMDMDTSKNERQLVFNIGNSQIRFSAKDFALVTGLRLGTSEAATTTTKLSSMYKNVFEGRPRITLKEVEEAFLRVSRDHEGRGELTLKLALLYFVFGILLPKDPHRAKVEVLYFHLVEDLEKFNTFSWGRASYEFLVSVVLLARVRMDSLKFATHAKARLVINGFVFALQIWAYEVMPSLAEYCAENIKNGPTQPRILCWTTPKKMIRFKNLKKFFAPGDGVHLVVDGIKGEVEELSPQPKKAKVVISNKDQKCSTSSGANEDMIIIISDDDDDGDDEENQNMRSHVASDDDSCSTIFLDNLVASIHK